MRILSPAQNEDGGEMAEVLLFHHAQGQTDGFAAFAEDLRRAGHTVHAPDLFQGRTFDSIDEGMAYAADIGFPDEIIARGEQAASELSEALVYAGFSLGVVPAQKLAQTRAGARGGLFFYSCLPPAYFGSWPAEVPVQIHGMDAAIHDRGNALSWCLPDQRVLAFMRARQHVELARHEDIQ